MIYLDSAATTLQKPPEVLRAVQKAMRNYASPGRGGHKAAMGAAETVFRCRLQAGKLFSCDPEQVVMTMNATHGLNMAIGTLVKPGGTVVISGFEHNAVLRPLTRLGAEISIAGRKVFDRDDTLEAFDGLIRPGVDAVVCTHVSNVFGYILPVKEIAQMCRERGVPLILDASQSAGCLPVNMGDLQADFIAMPGHKGLYGPQGTGLLLCGRLPEPLLCGGTGSLSAQREMPDFLPDRGEAGTPNVPGICGLAEGIRYVRRMGTSRILAHERGLCARLCSLLKGMDHLRLFTGESESRTGVLSFCVKGKDCEDVAKILAEHGCCVRAGLHCAPLAHESVGTLDCGTVRVSPSAFSRDSEIQMTAEILSEIAGGKGMGRK